MFDNSLHVKLRNRINELHLFSINIAISTKETSGIVYALQWIGLMWGCPISKLH